MTFTLFITFFFIGIGLCFDTFAVSVSFGILKREIQFMKAARVAIILALFQALMPVIGWLIGMSVKNLISSIDHWIAFGLLFLIGARMIYEGVREEEERREFDPSRLGVLLGVAVATSIDALVVGLSFGFLDNHILFPAAVIGMVTFIAAMLGMLFGKKISGKTSHRSIIVGGVILILIGLKILLEHLTA
jgi:manganese efflux pump family protein